MRRGPNAVVGTAIVPASVCRWSDHNSRKSNRRRLVIGEGVVLRW